MKQSTRFVFRASGVLGVGIALPLILYGVVQSVILSELPCPHADETAILFSHSDRIPGERLGLSGPNLTDLAAGVQSFQAIGAVALLGQREVLLPGGVETFREAYFSSSLPSVLGISPIRGRWFREDESRSGPPVAVMLSERFWRIRLGADPAVQGTVLHIRWRREEVPVAVVGVLPSLQILSLVFNEEPDIVFPASNLSEWYRRDSTLYQAVVRLRPGVPIDQIRGEIRRSAERLRNTYPRDNREFDPRILSLRSAILGKTERLLWSLFLATGVVWLIAAANFGALLAVRLEERQSEFAVRWALGARPRHLMIAISKEVAVVAMVGAGIGTLAGWIGIRLLQTHAQWFNVPRLLDARLSPTALLFGVSAALGIGFLGVLANASRYVRSSAQGLAQTASAQRSSPSIHFSEFVAAAQFCLGLVIVNTACLAGHSLVRDESRALGYDAHHVAAMQIRLPAPRSLVEKRRQQEVLQSFIDYAQAVPGVQTATGAYPRPTKRDFLREFVPVEDDAGSPRTILAIERGIASNYFQAMGIPLVRGRAFLSSEDFTSGTAVVNAAFMRAYFSDREVIGRRLYSKDLDPSKPLQIVGVVGDSLESPTDDAPQPTIYLRSFSNWLDLLVRADRPLEAVGPLIRFVRSQDQSIPVDQIEILDDAVQSPLGQSKTQVLLSTAFAIASIVLAGAGLYAVVRHTGDARRREYAIRLAIGATEARLIKLRLRQTARTVGIGLVSGIAGALAFGRIVQSMFFRVPAFDAIMLASATLILLAVAVVASYPSIKDTTTLDPSGLLRSS